MRRYNFRLSAFSLLTLLIVLLYVTKNSEAYHYVPDANYFSSMGDVDWSKRSIGSALNLENDVDDATEPKVKRLGGMYRNWLSGARAPAYQYHSMADTDWGWRKRSEASDEDDHEVPMNSYKNFLMKRYRGRDGYNHRPNYSYYRGTGRRHRPHSRYSSYSPYAQSVTSRRAPSIKRPRQSNFHSMADMDWGWKRKKRTGEGNPASFQDDERISEEELNGLLHLLSQNNGDDAEDVVASKRNIGSVMRHEKRNIASLARNDDFVEDDKGNDFMRKRNIASLVRHNRNFGSLMKGKDSRSENFEDPASDID